MSYINESDLIDGFNALAIQEVPHLYFDLETTGFGNAEVVQIAAVVKQQQFSVYINPQCEIHPRASVATNLYKINNELFYKNQKLQTVPKATAWAMFMAFVRANSPVLLVGHNIKSFDIKFLIRDLEECNLLNEFCTLVKEVLDTLPLFKKVFPGQKPYSQANIYKTMVGGDYTAHNALFDVLALQTIISNLSIDNLMIAEHNFSFTAHVRFLAIKNQLKGLEQHGAKAGTVKKLAEAGITLESLMAAYVCGNTASVCAVIGGIRLRQNTIDILCRAVESFHQSRQFPLTSFSVGGSSRVCHSSGVVNNTCVL